MGALNRLSCSSLRQFVLCPSSSAVRALFIRCSCSSIAGCSCSSSALHRQFVLNLWFSTTAKPEIDPKAVLFVLCSLFLFRGLVSESCRLLSGGSPRATTPDLLACYFLESRRVLLPRVPLLVVSSGLVTCRFLARHAVELRVVCSCLLYRTAP